MSSTSSTVKDWGAMKKKDYEAIRNNNTNCDCAVCQGKDLEPFYEGKVLDVLAKAKVHDHLAQRKELEGARESIKKGRFLSLPQHERVSQRNSSNNYPVRTMRSH